MQVVMGVGALRTALTRALGVAGTKGGTLPILSCVLLSAEQTPEGGRLTVRANDLESELATEHPCEVKVAGAVALPAKTLADVVKSLSESTVVLKSTAAHRVEITSGAASFRLAGLSPEDFPVGSVLGSSVSWEPVRRAALLAALDRVRYAMSSEESRYNLNGVFFEDDDGGLALVATDGHRLAVVQEPESPTYGLKLRGVIVSRKAVDELRALLAEEGADAGSVGELAFTDTQVCYRRQGLAYRARLIDGGFPAWQQVVPSVGTGQALDVDRPALRDSLRRVLLLAQDVAASVTLELSPGVLRLSTRTPELGDAADTVEVAYTGPEQSLCLNGRLLAEAVAAETGGPLRFAITGDTAPVLMTPIGVAGVRHVLMPMRR